MCRITFLLFTVLALPVFSQVSLPYTINSGVLPSNSDPIAPFTIYQDTSNQFVQSGFQPGNVVPDFILFDTSGVATQLSSLLAQGKPVLLVSASFSCPASRYSMQYVLPDIETIYGQLINICVVYTLDAHPISPDICPYTGTVYVPGIDYADSALIHQATTYEGRKQDLGLLCSRYNPPFPMLVDGPGNEYWNTFGPAPNNAYLLAPDGRVFTKYGWCAHSENQLETDIPLLLATVGINTVSAASNVSIYPNPSPGEAKLVVQNETAYNFTVVDMSGRTVASEQNVTAPVADLEKYALDAGVYSVIVNAASGRSFALRYVKE